MIVCTEPHHEPHHLHLQVTNLPGNQSHRTPTLPGPHRFDPTPSTHCRYAASLIKHYYDTLTTHPGGPSTTDYPWDVFMLDYKRCMWVSMWVSCMGLSNIACIEEEAERQKGTEAGEAFNTLRSNMVPLLIAFMTRHLNECKRCDAASVLK